MTVGWLRQRGATAAADALHVPSGAGGGLALPGDWHEPIAETAPEDLPARTSYKSWHDRWSLHGRMAQPGLPGQLLLEARGLR